ncbi:hypothetical protein DFJ73DRAFT_757534 [Zopfochytrium polystomum]|nr:hypothetical protein DFJ73DRAFT_757534 [Zopfochytrium polystomum]
MQKQHQQDHQRPPVRIAVVGSGLAGLSIATILSRSFVQGGKVVDSTPPFHVHLLERGPSLGMDSASISAPCFCSECDPLGDARAKLAHKDPTIGHVLNDEHPHVDARLDVPMRSFFPDYYPQLQSILEAIQIPYVSSDNSMSFFNVPPPDVDQPEQHFHLPKSFPTRLDHDVARTADSKKNRTFRPNSAYFSFSCLSIPHPINNPFQKSGLASAWSWITFDSLPTQNHVAQETSSLPQGVGRENLVESRWGQFLKAHKYSTAFADDVFLLLFSGVCTCSMETIRNFPAAIVIEYVATCMPFGRMSFVSSGMKEVCKRLAEPVNKVSCGVTVTNVPHQLQLWNSITLYLQRKRISAHGSFGAALKAKWPRRSLERKKRQTSPWCSDILSVLDRFPYERSLVVCHTDTSLLPACPSTWRCLNFGRVPEASDDADGSSTALPVPSESVSNFSDDDLATRVSDDEDANYDDDDRPTLVSSPRPSPEPEGLPRPQTAGASVAGVTAGYDPKSVAMCTHITHFTHPEKLPSSPTYRAGAGRTASASPAAAAYPILLQTTNPIRAGGRRPMERSAGLAAGAPRERA